MRYLLALLLTTTASLAIDLVSIPLTLYGTGVYTWPNAIWWTNVPPPQAVQTWQAWWAARENFSRLSTALAGAGGGSTATALTNGNAYIGTNGAASFATLTAGNLADAHTNSLLSSPISVAYTTNSFTATWGTTNVLPWNITNFATLDYDSQYGVAGNKPVILWSTNAGAAWHVLSGALAPRLGVTKLALTDWDHAANIPPALQMPINPVISNVIVRVQVRPDLFGKTNHLFAQKLLVDYPDEDYAAANKGYVDNLYQTTTWWSASGDVQLNGFDLHLNSSWRLQSGSNYLRAAFLNNESFSATHPWPVPVTNGVSADMVGTNLVVTVATNGLTGVPALELSHYVAPANWQFSAATPVLTGTNWVFTLGQPWTDTGFVMAVVQSANPGVFSLAGVLKLAPRTITAANASTWGNGAGLVCVDSNYVYVAVGTNLWKRAGISSW